MTLVVYKSILICFLSIVNTIFDLVASQDLHFNASLICSGSVLLRVCEVCIYLFLFLALCLCQNLWV